MLKMNLLRTSVFRRRKLAGESLGQITHRKQLHLSPREVFGCSSCVICPCSVQASKLPKWTTLCMDVSRRGLRVFCGMIKTHKSRKKIPVTYDCIDVDELISCSPDRAACCHQSSTIVGERHCLIIAHLESEFQVFQIKNVNKFRNITVVCS